MFGGGLVGVELLVVDTHVDIFFYLFFFFCSGLLIFITHVHIRDRPSLYQENPSMPVEPVSDDVYDEHLKCGTSHTMHRIQSPMYDFFCSALVESSHRKTVPVFSMVVDLWLAYCQPWHAVKRTCEKPRIAGQSKSRLGIDVNAANRTGSSRESHSNNKNKRKNKNNKAGVRRDAWARRSARENDPVTREWLSYVVHNYFFYVEMLTIVMSRSYKFDYSRHGTGELDLMERVLAMYTPNLRSILNQCRLYLNISLLHPHDDLSIQAKEELQQLQSNGRLFVGSGFANVLKMQYSKIEPNDIHKIHLRMPTMGKDSIQFIVSRMLFLFLALVVGWWWLVGGGGGGGGDETHVDLFVFSFLFRPMNCKTSMIKKKATVLPLPPRCDNISMAKKVRSEA